METTANTKKSVAKKATTGEKKDASSTRDRIKPRGLWGIMKGKIHYDKDADIFNLGL
ncbi:hypothetical protein [Viscerimonas tarda]